MISPFNKNLLGQLNACNIRESHTLHILAAWPFTRLPSHNFKQQQAIVVKGKGDAIIAPLIFG